LCERCVPFPDIPYVIGDDRADLFRATDCALV
jgi:hypothetical protein